MALGRLSTQPDVQHPLHGRSVDMQMGASRLRRHHPRTGLSLCLRTLWHDLLHAFDWTGSSDDSSVVIQAGECCRGRQRPKCLRVNLADAARQYYFTSRILGFVTLSLSKLCMLMFTRSIFSAGFRGEKTQFTVAYALLGVYGIASVLLSSAGCDPDKALISRENAVCNANVSPPCYRIGILADFITRSRDGPSSQRSTS